MLQLEHSEIWCVSPQKLVDPNLFQPLPPRFFRYVKRIAEIVGEEMGLEGLEFGFTGGLMGVVDGWET